MRFLILLATVALECSATPVTVTQGTVHYFNATYPRLESSIHAGDGDFSITGYAEAGGPSCTPCAPGQQVSPSISINFPYWLGCCSPTAGYSMVTSDGVQYHGSAWVQLAAPVIVLAAGQTTYSIPFTMEATARQGQETDTLAYCVTGCLTWQIEGSGIATAHFVWSSVGYFDNNVSIDYAFGEPPQAVSYVAIPEPGTWATGLVILCGLTIQTRRAR